MSYKYIAMPKRLYQGHGCCSAVLLKCTGNGVCVDATSLHKPAEPTPAASIAGSEVNALQGKTSI